jgi:hypothetical protein
MAATETLRGFTRHSKSNWRNFPNLEISTVKLSGSQVLNLFHGQNRAPFNFIVCSGAKRVWQKADSLGTLRREYRPLSSVLISWNN